MNNRSVLRSTLALVATLLMATSAHALLFRAYVASTGSDANPCTLPQPCRLLPAALAAVADGGEIWMLDSANYNTGTVVIGKSVSLLAIPGAVGSVVANNGPAINIATAGVKVALRNMVIARLPGASGDGIDMSGGAALTVENCLIAGLSGSGIRVTTAADVLITATTLRDGSAFGLVLNNGPRVTVVRSTISGWINGFRIGGASTSSTTTVDIADSTISGNPYGVVSTSYDAAESLKISIRGSQIVRSSYFGVSGDSLGGGPIRISLSDNVFHNNGGDHPCCGAVNVDGSMVKVWATNNTISENLVGISVGPGASFESAGNNAVRNNGTDTAGTISVIATK